MTVDTRIKLYDVSTGRWRLLAPTALMRILTCLTCGRSWDDARITGITPVPAGRCPFEYKHK